MTERYPQRPLAVPVDATEVVLVRHGASADAIPGEAFDLVGGQANPPLSPVGEAEARAVGARLAAEPFAGLFVTPLRRTAQTAAPLADLTGAEPIVVEDLREVYLGDWDGGEYRIRLIRGDPLARRTLTEERWDVLPGAESMEALAQRVRAGLDRVVAAVGPGAVAVVVAHGGVIGELCRQATDSRPFAFVHADNGSITRLVVFAGGRRLLRSFNDTAHLTAEPAVASVRPQPLISVADVERASRFYQRVLGATSGHGGPEYERLLVDGTLVLQLHRLDVEHHHGTIGDPEQPTGNGVALWFEVDDFDAAVGRIGEAEVEIVTDVHVNPNAGHREIWIRDLDAYLVVVAESGP